MAVERLTDYTRRIWTALDADAPEGHDFEVGDVIYYMDSSQCGIVTYVYPEGSIDVEFLPDVGGGGGGGGYSADDNVTIRLGNKTGITMPARSVYYDSVLSCIFPDNPVTNIPTDNWRELEVLNQNGWFPVWLKFNSAYTPRSVTYNGNNLPFEKDGSTATWRLKIQMPDNYDPETQIIIN